MASVSATRSELLARRARIRIAAQGRDLLKDRRSALAREFQSIGALALESMSTLDPDARDAGQFLGIAIGADGREPLESAALAAVTGVEVAVRTWSVDGVPFV
jgi:V/A-type H+-transporting ATPase subunit D